MKKIIAYLQQPRPLALAIALASAALLAAAYISQYGFGLRPCPLCLYQRVPYALNIVFGALAALASLRYPRLVGPILWLAVVSFFADAAIAAFHVGVEQKWWPGLSSCGGALPQNATVEELQAFLSKQGIVRCDEPAWTLFGISMAGYNFLAALFLGVFTLCLLRKKDAA